MREFDKLCKEFENLDALTYGALLAEKSLKIIPALGAITEDGLSGVQIFNTFILGAMAADGKLSEEEYLLCYPLIKVFFGDELTYEDCAAVFRKLKKDHRELKKSVDEMVDVLGLVSEDLKDDIILVCLAICAIDGKVSLSEKAWIKKLIK